MDITSTGIMQEKEMLKDVLTSQKLAASTYSSFAGECATGSVRNDFLNILREEHDIEMDIFTEMHTRGYYPTPLADQQKIVDAKDKYSSEMPYGISQLTINDEQLTMIVVGVADKFYTVKSMLTLLTV